MVWLKWCIPVLEIGAGEVNLNYHFLLSYPETFHSHFGFGFGWVGWKWQIRPSVAEVGRQMGNRCLPTLPPFHQVSLVLLNSEGCKKYWPFVGGHVPSFLPSFHLFQQQYLKRNQCNSSFIDTSTLRTHLKTHSGEKSNNALFWYPKIFQSDI